MSQPFVNQKYIVSDDFYRLFLPNGQLVNGNNTTTSSYKDDINTFDVIFKVATKYLTDNDLMDIHQKIKLDRYLASLFRMSNDSLITLDEYEKLIYMLISPTQIKYKYTNGQQNAYYVCTNGYIPQIQKRKPRSIPKMRQHTISDKMLKYLGEPSGTTMTRPVLLSKLCQRCKDKGLSDTSNRQFIIPDKELSSLLGCEEGKKILQIAIGKYLQLHIS